ncbi:23S rRNA (pseudouridine(1915)-N(3))-methyltransferase RlmH [Geminicoccus roseus]|uniref:23S rRNA (pseudouridine(1915)-N(3))-methyltransferase RlmH n=1 Tax=Geminicoccus roseus TaxID=404900 RepID=UPI00048200C0|nr:23S rRNA (pseudouridine(1915)-N(3))-methyltransferase RlmH [Geminicoccus roseus]
MRVTILAVGRSKDTAIDGLVESYRQRCPLLAPVVEVESRKPADDPGRRDDEARLLLSRLPSGATVVALDEHGRQFTSIGFAERLGAWRDQGVRDLALLIGGAAGHGGAVLERADLKLAFGTMTWPHMLVRVMLAEQVYRASTILAGHPYHRA